MRPTFPPARVDVSQRVIDEIRDIPVVENTYGDITGLPDPEEGVVYIVSTIVRQALGDSRPDVMSPDTGSTAVRENGRLVGVTRLVSACS